jgi:hypothetical protein
MLPKEWVNPQGEEFMPEARPCEAVWVSTVDQPVRGGIDG